MAGLGSPERRAELLGGVRLASGIAFVAFSTRLSRLLVGRDADAPGAQLFVRAFGARDAILGAATLFAARTHRSQRPWLLACGLADAFDAAAVAVAYRRLPPKRRALTLSVSAVPALLNLGAARRLADRA